MEKVDSITTKDIFEYRVWPALIEKKQTPEATPSVYVLGGQPGAGKSNLQKEVQLNQDNPYRSHLRM